MHDSSLSACRSIPRFLSESRDQRAPACALAEYCHRVSRRETQPDCSRSEGLDYEGISLLAILFSILCASAAFAADRLRIAYSSISGAYTGIWVAHDAGFFAKEGLEDQIILIPSATQLAQVTVAGDVDIASLGGGPVIAAVLSGADLRVIGNNVNKMIFSLHTKPEVKSIEELRGKRIGVSRFGSSSDVSARYACEN